MKTPQQQAEELFFNLESSYNPGKYVSIIAELIQAKEERDQLQQHVKSLELRITDLKGKLSMIEDTNFRWSGEIKQLQSTNTDLVKDKERLEWGIQFPVTFMNISCSSGGMSDKELKQARKAIDSAMKGSK